MFVCLTLLILVLALTSVEVATSVRVEKLPRVSGSILLTDESLERFALNGRQSDLAEVCLLEISGQSFRKALRVSTSDRPSSEWNVQLSTPVDTALERDHVCLARFWMRCTDAMTGEGFVTFVYEMACPEFDKAAEVRLGAGGAWTEYFVPFRAPRDFPAGEAQVCLRVGFERQTIEFGGLQIINYGSSVALDDLPRTRVSYKGRRHDASWRQAALARIDELRKADLVLKVVDAKGRPVPGATVHVRQTRHAFRFGSCVTAGNLLDPSPEAEKYRQVVRENFNWAVFENDMKWQALADGISPRLDQALQWLYDHRIAVRGHNLFWPSWRWLPAKLRQHQHDLPMLRSISEKHALDVVGHFKGKLPQWDVVNEPYTNHDLIDLLGGPAVMVDWFCLAHQADPQCKLFLNDYGIFEAGPHGTHSEHFYSAIQSLISHHAPIHGIGIQSHFGAALPSPLQVLATLDKFSELGLPIELTEMSLNLADRELQADYLRDFMIAAFSHTNVQGMMLWGFWEGSHWRPQSALFSRDWSIYPHGRAWMDLVNREWRTQADSTTNADGVSRLRGFLGEYEAVVSVGGKSFRQEISLVPGDASHIITVP